MYNSQFFMGIRIGTIPLEDFLFGFSMVTLSIVCWEYFKKKR
jgi:lycopene cyclase domain-containing protein